MEVTRRKDGKLRASAGGEEEVSALTLALSQRESEEAEDRRQPCYSIQTGCVKAPLAAMSQTSRRTQ
jgi:hypothetical protein